MITVLEGLQQLEETAPRGGGRTTGFVGLDDATGGFELGRTWIVTGTPGRGARRWRPNGRGYWLTSTTWRPSLDPSGSRHH